MSFPKLSIITINLNNAIGLRKTIESVINQTFTGYEYIVVDGGSTDSSVEVIKEFADKIAYWVSEADKGIYNAMNKGIQKANGSYVQFLNSGDYLFNRSILEEIFNKYLNAEIIYTDGYMMNTSGEIKRLNIPDQLSLLHLIDYSICHPGTFILKRTFDKVGLYNENNKIVSDTEFFIKAYLQGIAFHKVNLASVFLEPHGISQTNCELLKMERQKMIISCTNEDYYRLFQDRISLTNQLSFLKKSKLIRFFLKHMGNYYINRIIRIF